MLTTHLRRIVHTVFIGALGFVTVCSARAQDTPQPVELEPGYLRVTEGDDGVMSLDIAITTFASEEDADAPTITLVGVAHLGDGEYYATLQDLLEQHDLVLYESVMPDGVNRSAFENDEQRQAYTRSALTFVWAQAIAFENTRGRHPKSLQELSEFSNSRDSRTGDWIAHATDGWGQPLQYDCTDDGACVLFSYGADGATGGAEYDTDIFSFEPDIAAKAAAYAQAPDDQLQAQLAEALNLEFQLDSINYARDGWLCSDMTMNELNDAMTARGLDFGPISSTLAGTSLSGTIVKVLLGIMKVANAMLDGAIVDMFKVVMIEMLGDEQIMEQGLEQFGAGFGDVIIGDRNQVVMDDLEAVVGAAEYETIAVFYGAGHLPDFETRLREQLGYEPVVKRWEPAISVDLASSSIPEQQLRQLRFMIRRSMQQNMAMQRARRKN